MATSKLPPGPKGLPIIGNTIAYARDPVGYLYGMTGRYGDVIYYKVGPTGVYFLNSPEYVRDVLVTQSRKFVKGPWTGWLRPMLGSGLLTSDGEFHLRQRRMAQPAFHRNRIAAFGDVMTGVASRTSDRWQDGALIDANHEMMSLTLNVVAQTLFSGDVETETEEIGEALTAFLEWWFLFTLPGASIIQKLPLPINKRYERSKARIDSTIYRLIREHREGKGDPNDLLSMLLRAQDTEGDGGRMTDQQLRDEAVTIVLAGHETTANALTWTWYLLSQYPEVERELHRELDDVLDGRTPTLEDLPKLRYTEMVFAESLRLYPPAWSVDRIALESYQAGEYTVPQGAVVVLSQYTMHRDPRYFPNPSRFDPLRWTPEEKAKRPKYSYFPFGGGNRLCIGEQFAWMEGVLILATLARHWKLRLAPGQTVRTQPLVTLRPRHGIRMILERRSTARQARTGVESVAAL